MAKPKVRIGCIDAANGPFTGVQIQLDIGGWFFTRHRRAVCCRGHFSPEDRKE